MLTPSCFAGEKLLRGIFYKAHLNTSYYLESAIDRQYWSEKEFPRLATKSTDPVPDRHTHLLKLTTKLTRVEQRRDLRRRRQGRSNRRFSFMTRFALPMPT